MNFNYDTVISSELKKLSNKNWFSNLSMKIPKNFKFWSKSIFKLILEMFLITFVVYTLVFFIVSAIPGEPKAIAEVQDKVSPEVLARLRSLYHLDKPLFQQYLHSLGNVFNGSFGYSGSSFQLVSDVVFPKIGLSLQIGLISIGFSFLFGIPLGILFARRKSTTSDIFAALAAILAFSIPSFVLGLAVMGINYSLGLPIIFEYNNAFMLLIPAFVISIPVGMRYTRYLRGSVREEYNKQYVDLARVKGLNERKVLWKHVIKPSFFPMATFLPFVIIATIFGSVTIETIFAIPGSGTLLIDSALEKDRNMILAITLFYTLLIVFSFFVRDILIKFIDPRAKEK